MAAEKRDVIRIDGVYYDTQRLAGIHPGGALIVNLANQTDGTSLFYSSHRRAFPHSKYTSFVVPPGEVASEVRAALPQTQQDYKLYLEICDRVRPLLAPTKGFAPWWYFIKVVLLLSVVVGLDVASFWWTRPVWSTVVQSMCLAWIGLNIQHDANHGAVSPNPLVNRILGLGQDLCGGASVAWMYNHNVLHHVHCNDTEKDNDLNIPLLRLMKKVPWRVWFRMQQFYFLVMSAGFGPLHVLTNQIYIWKGPSAKMKFVAREWNVSRVISLIIPLRVLGFFMTQPTPADVLMHTMIQYCLGGFYLAFFFLISHNFVGARKEGVDSSKGCFVKHQVETSSNVGGWLLAFFNGGLNFQIEHHLFPRVHHSYYHLIAPVVRKACVEAGITYVHFPTIADNFASTFAHLEQLGTNPKDVYAMSG